MQVKFPSCRQRSSLPKSSCQKGCPFFCCLFVMPLPKIRSYCYVVFFFLGPLFCSIGLPVCFQTSSTPSLSTLLWYNLRSSVFIFPVMSLLLKQLWLSIFFGFILILGLLVFWFFVLLFFFYEDCHQRDENCTNSVDYFWQNSHSHIISGNPGAWKVFFIIQCLHFLSLVS